MHQSDHALLAGILSLRTCCCRMIGGDFQLGGFGVTGRLSNRPARRGQSRKWLDSREWRRISERQRRDVTSHRDREIALLLTKCGQYGPQFWAILKTGLLTS